MLSSCIALVSSFEELPMLTNFRQLSLKSKRCPTSLCSFVEEARILYCIIHRFELALQSVLCVLDRCDLASHDILIRGSEGQLKTISQKLRPGEVHNADQCSYAVDVMYFMSGMQNPLGLGQTR